MSELELKGKAGKRMFIYKNFQTSLFITYFLQTKD
jgi:hypothetical protein